MVDRLPPTADVIDPAQEQASADELLRHLIQASEEELDAYSGAVGLLADKNGEPRQMPLEHGVLRLGLG